jgi:hypothetical protein
MTDDPKTNRNASAARSNMEPIRVKEIRFCVVNGRNLPLTGIGVNGGVDILQAGPKAGGELVLEYKPWLRHHHVRFFEGEGNKRKLTSQCLIPESWATWVPEDDTL